MRSEPALVRRASDGEVGGQSGGFANLLAAGVKIGLPPPPKKSWGWAEPQTDAASPLPSHLLLGRWSAPDWV